MKIGPPADSTFPNIWEWVIWTLTFKGDRCRGGTQGKQSFKARGWGYYWEPCCTSGAGPDDHDGHDAGYDDGGGNHERILESILLRWSLVTFHFQVMSIDEAVVPDHEDDDNKDHDGGAVVDAIDRMLALEEIAQLKGFKCWLNDWSSFLSLSLCFQLRYLQTLSSIAAENNSTIVFPLPIDIISHLMTNTMANTNTEDSNEKL